LKSLKTTLCYAVILADLQSSYLPISVCLFFSDENNIHKASDSNFGRVRVNGKLIRRAPAPAASQIRAKLSTVKWLQSYFGSR